MIKLCTIDYVHERRDEQPKICANQPKGSAWRNTWNIRPLFFIFIFSRTHLLK